MALLIGCSLNVSVACQLKMNFSSNPFNKLYGILCNSVRVSHSCSVFMMISIFNFSWHATETLRLQPINNAIHQPYFWDLLSRRTWWASETPLTKAHTLIGSPTRGAWMCVAFVDNFVHRVRLCWEWSERCWEGFTFLYVMLRVHLCESD
jgi:hypothetical protein